MKIRDVMRHLVETVDAGDSAEATYAIMRTRGIRHLVVTRIGQEGIAGIVSDRDLGGPHGEPLRRSRSVGDFMTPHVVSAEPDTTVRQAANLMRGRTIGCLPVLEHGRLVGIVTVSDLLELIGRGLEKPLNRTERGALAKRAPRRKPTTASTRA